MMVRIHVVRGTFIDDAIGFCDRRNARERKQTSKVINFIGTNFARCDVARYLFRTRCDKGRIGLFADRLHPIRTSLDPVGAEGYD